MFFLYKLGQGMVNDRGESTVPSHAAPYHAFAPYTASPPAPLPQLTQAGHHLPQSEKKN
jgi:hypothetical protein